MPYPKVVPGLRVEPWEIATTTAQNERLHTAVGRSTPADGTLSDLLAANLNVGMCFRVLPRNVVHVRQTIRRRSDAHAGALLRFEAAVTEVGRRRGSAYVTVSGTITVDRRPVWDLLSEMAVPSMPVDNLADMDRPRLVIPPEAVRLADTERTFTLQDMALFSGPGNFHSDREIAHRLGFPAPLAQGVHVAAVGFGLLDDTVARWNEAAVVDLRFVRPVEEGATVHMSLLGSEEGAHAGTFPLWLEGRSDDEVVLVAQVSGGV